ncbi:MAG: diversity-generating retroelement protein Avd [Nitrospinaceae bacterium]|nr:diversity-generating retroelement protein Avd [Nitrospinaceae bacterium]
MAKQEFLVIKRGYDFSKWLLNHTGKFPKSYRFSVAAKLENAILEFIEMTSVANMRKNKLPLLRRADESLVKLRLLFRLSYEMRFINLKSYEYGSKQLVELGKLLGGWIKNPGSG